VNNPIIFWDKWSSDPKQKIFRKYDFIPYIYESTRRIKNQLLMRMYENIYGKMQDEEKNK
jgi:hypothetical protein